MRSNHSFGCILIAFIIFLLGLMALLAQCRLGSWPVVIHLARFTLAIMSLALLGGAILEALVGRRKSLRSNLVGLPLFLALLGVSAWVCYRLVTATPPGMTLWEKSVETAALMLGGDGAAMFGRWLVVRGK